MADASVCRVRCKILVQKTQGDRRARTDLLIGQKHNSEDFAAPHDEELYKSGHPKPLKLALVRQSGTCISLVMVSMLTQAPSRSESTKTVGESRRVSKEEGSNA